jgi:hypothetical protein
MRTLLLCGVLASMVQDPGYVTEGVTHPGGDQIFWVPTMAQAEEMSRATGRPIFAMGGV